MLRALASLGAVTLVAAAAHAASPELINSNDKVQTYESTTFMCTGITDDTRNNPANGDYSLKLMFSTVEGDYVADVHTTVRNAGGDVVLEASCYAPWLLADLAPGRYEVTARVAQGETRKTTITVAEGQQTSQVIQFPSVKGT